MGATIDLSGQRFGRLLVVSGPRKVGAELRWACRCDCGASTEVSRGSLRRGGTRSCGCLNREVRAARLTKHGMVGHPLYSTWHAMRARCNDPRHKHYGNYGGRGIAVCERWSDFGLFVADIPLRPTADHQLDRIDNSRGYEPGNVTWATRREQNRNKRTNVTLTHEGITLCVEDWARRLGMTPQAMASRIRRATSVAEALRPKGAPRLPAGKHEPGCSKAA